MKHIDSFVDKCVGNGYISQDQAPWLRYGIEKRVLTILLSIPMLILGSWISSPAMAASFYISFFTLRSRTSGIHAKTVAGCCFCSILAEGFFLGILPRIWSSIAAIILLSSSAILIAVLAPYNHPNMDLSPEEFAECAASAKKWLFMLILAQMVLRLLQLNQLADGIVLGIVMVAVTLTLAYIPKGGKQNETV